MNPTEQPPSEQGDSGVPIRFILESPEELTGTDQSEWIIEGVVGDNLLELALNNGINIEHSCGGVCACSTCHIYVEKGMDQLSEASEDEEDRVEEAPGLQRNSRLCCQCTIEKDITRQWNGRPARELEEIIVRIPSWNRNAVKEVPH